MRNRIKKILKENKIIVVIILISIISIYFFSIRPSQIRKQCSTITKYDSYQYINSEYNEKVEKQKQEKLGEYIQCRNNFLIKGDQITIPLGNRYTFTQTQYNTLPLDELNRLTNKFAPSLFSVYFYNYNGYFIDNPTYRDLKENKDKYPQCYFPDNFVKKEFSGGSESSKDASNDEYKICLRKHGIDH